MRRDGINNRQKNCERSRKKIRKLIGYRNSMPVRNSESNWNAALQHFRFPFSRPFSRFFRYFASGIRACCWWKPILFRSSNKQTRDVPNMSKLVTCRECKEAADRCERRRKSNKGTWYLHCNSESISCERLHWIRTRSLISHYSSW